MNNARIKNIEFLRIIGCISVIMFHLFLKTGICGNFANIDIYNKFAAMSCNGNKAVDLFFLLSGFFFAYRLDLQNSFYNFFIKKVARLYPILIFTLILYFIISLFKICEFKFYDNIFTLLGLNGIGLILQHGNGGHLWFVSTMFWSLLFYFYLLKNFEKKNIKLFLIFTILFCYSFLVHIHNGKIYGAWTVYYNIFDIGLLRALGGIGIGYFIGEWYKANIENIKTWKATTLQTISLSSLEFVTLYFIINNLMLHKLKYNNQFIFIIAFTAMTMLFLVKKGIFSRILDKDFWFNISKYTYSIYMIHMPIYSCLRNILWKNHPEIVYAHPILNIVFTLALVIVAGVLTYHFVEKPSYKYLTNRFCQSPQTCMGVERERERVVLLYDFKTNYKAA